MTDKIIVYTTCSNEEAAGKLASHLVEQRVAACVSIVQARSHYRWKGAVEQAQEWMLLIKSSRPLFESLRREIVKAHEYELPEVLAVSVLDGTPDYLAWIEDSLQPVTT
jgi:periplasmic divalent cation tolerance protein